MLKKNSLDKLIYQFAKLPGLGPRSARRIILHLLKHKESKMLALADSLNEAASSIKECNICYNIDTSQPCNICNNPSRDKSLLCVVESVADLWAIERSQVFNGYYHVLGGVLSAMSNVTPEDLHLPELKLRMRDGEFKELIMATNSTIEGQTTAFYITDFLKDINVKISRLASGIPIGGELDYLDEGTLVAALSARKQFDEQN